MCATATTMRAFPATSHAVAAAPVASRTQTMLQHLEKLATGGQAFIRSVQDMHVRGVLDRQKVLDFVRIVSLFNKATGKDTSHGLMDMVHHLLPHLPEDGGHSNSSSSNSNSHNHLCCSTRARAMAHMPAELDELSCYLISRGGRGAESVFCSEAMNQLFLSTDELTLTLEETGLTSVSVWASFMTEESLAKCNAAVATVFLQRDTEQLDVELECVTRTGILLTCDATVSYRVHPNGESTMILSLVVKQDAGTLAPPSRSHPGVPVTLADKEAAAAAAAAVASTSSRRTCATERRASLASKRQHREEEQKKRSCNRRDNSIEATTRPRAKRAAVSDKRRKITPAMMWSQEGPPLPAGMANRAPKSATVAGGVWSRNDKTGGVAWQPVMAKAQQVDREWVTAPRHTGHHQPQEQQEEEEEELQQEVWCSTLAQPMTLAPSCSATTALPTEAGSSSSIISISSNTSSGTSVEDDLEDNEQRVIWEWADSIWQGTSSPDLGLDDTLEGAAAATGGGVLNVDPSMWLMLDQPGL